MRTSALFRARLSFQKTVVTRYRIRAKSFQGWLLVFPVFQLTRYERLRFHVLT